MRSTKTADTDYGISSQAPGTHVPPFRALGTSAHLHHVDDSVRVLHVVLGLADFHANSAGEALATLQNVEPETAVAVKWEIP